MNTKKLSITDWIAHNYAGSGAPNERTVLRWIKAGSIYPPPTREGKRLYIREDAQVVSGGDSILERLNERPQTR